MENQNQYRKSLSLNNMSRSHVLAQSWENEKLGCTSLSNPIRIISKPGQRYY